MALQNLDQQILDYFAEGVSGDIGLTQAMLDDWASHGREIIVNMMPDKLLDGFTATSAEQTSNGFATTVKYIRKVVRESGTNNDFVPCRMIGAQNSYAYQSIASSSDPYAYVEDGKVYVIPDPSASEEAFKVAEVDVSNIDVSAVSTISNFPETLVSAVIYYAVTQGKLVEAGKMRRNVQDEIEAITTSGILANLSSTGGVYEEVETALDAANTEIDKVSADIDTASTTISNADYEDFEKGRAELSVAQERLNNAAGYLHEASGRSGKGSIYLSEVGARVNTASEYLNQAMKALDEYKYFKSQFNEIVTGYLGANA